MFEGLVVSKSVVVVDKHGEAEMATAGGRRGESTAAC